ncbi:Oidioi.mRNA.OKI2018_I69.chr2.g5589.t1.cds [Oikopleura dioica]|uniref:Oidioi.mRNA.OKI2018_I69.chr2.g5589.t1.cds n=1 Tax=Oikopleura dioica TaxID=34765 RepID=A0ABN7T6Q2_OIKDI|nr:Oidioi.mRNA.OKI2018_I69.chr2.g5589.t1.cds [Oikopleura dioica]
MTEDKKIRRSIRSTAGNRYQALLRSEEKDEFYEGHYGGFTEEEDDNDFSGSSSSDESISDSSSDDDENESDGEGQNEPEKVERKRKKNVYKDPAKSTRKKADNAGFAAPKKPKLSHTTSGERKSSRKHTTEQRHELEQTIKTRELVEKKKKPKKAETHLTQEQKMAEALKTEEYNLSQLHLYQEMEASRKNKSKRKKAKKIEGPSIKITSRTIQIESSKDDKNGTNSKEAHTFVEFSDRASFEKTFNYKKPVPAKREYCVITGKLARYRTRDGIPFFDCASYKLIESRREAKT